MGHGRRLRRGIYLLPTFFTVANLLAGFYSVILATSPGADAKAFAMAAVLIIVAGVLDGLDGRIARMTGSTSDFGLEFDSLADLVSFGIAPALLAYHWALVPLGRLGWLVAFFYLICAAMRLARFNIQHRVVDRRFFAGLPSPAAAGTVAAVVFAFPSMPDGRGIAGLAAGMMAGLAVLMVSRLRYRSFKHLNLRDRRSYLYVLAVAALLAAVALHPAATLLGMAACYVLSGLVGYAWSLLRRGKGKTGEPAGPVVEASNGTGSR